MKFDNDNENIAWCRGCGNFGILRALKMALEELNFQNTQTVVVSGIGQASKTPQYISANYFNGLHGRPLPVAVGIKASNKNLNVVVTAGDGDVYGEGGNHFIHTIRRNPDITALVYNNMTYGLTKGQASPTSSADFITKTQPKGALNEPFEPIALAVAQNISFAARTIIVDLRATVDIIKEAISHKGFALVDILTHCPSYNKVNNFKWIKENTYYPENHDNANRIAALKLELESEKMPLGVIFKQEKTTFEENLANIEKTKMPLYQVYQAGVDFEKLKNYL
ncbi:2-oxoglutarate/2-oxoacid ferredoxin oxidoreductase subunit beta [Candidatus Gastranaerophilus sp. (ex Termes propinquus)]|nr:2-oxoglutarate/2-oxoacid ferredoxin oxidoreductase subunit beta [Candidatus Gastranaerophilus sp. (ex Termes propinquus)]